MDKEIWKDVPDFEGYYEVSNLGNVRSVNRIVTQNNNGKLTKTLYKGRTIAKARRGNYLMVHLSKGGKPCWKSIHRLVALAYIKKEEGKNIVNHLDNNPHNNNANNLEWTTYRGNMQHASKQGRMKGNPQNCIKHAMETRKKIVAFNDKETITFTSILEAAKKGFNRRHIVSCCNKEYGYKTHKGYEWRWCDD